MPRLALINMCLGFLVLLFATFAGVITAYDHTATFLYNTADKGSWHQVLQTSSHGHTALFGVIQVLFGLSLAWSPWSAKIKGLQTVGLFLGVIAMGPLLLLKSGQPPSEGFDLLGISLGFCLAMHSLSLAVHLFGLSTKTFAR